MPFNATKISAKKTPSAEFFSAEGAVKSFPFYSSPNLGEVAESQRGISVFRSLELFFLDIVSILLPAIGSFICLD